VQVKDLLKDNFRGQREGQHGWCGGCCREIRKKNHAGGEITHLNVSV
jgi:hypothetical protein